jgi:hypothetical protein
MTRVLGRDDESWILELFDIHFLQPLAQGRPFASDLRPAIENVRSIGYDPHHPRPKISSGQCTILLYGFHRKEYPRTYSQNHIFGSRKPRWRACRADARNQQVQA